MAQKEPINKNEKTTDNDFIDTETVAKGLLAHKYLKAKNPKKYEKYLEEISKE